MNDEARSAFRQRVETIEEAYEFCLAYAAQGRESEGGEAQGIRHYLERMAQALDGLATCARTCVTRDGGAIEPQWVAYIELLDTDARNAASAVNLALAQPSIGSQLVDNLNASLHVRTLLTDLFLVDEAMK